MHGPLRCFPYLLLAGWQCRSTTWNAAARAEADPPHAQERGGGISARASGVRKRPATASAKPKASPKLGAKAAANKEKPKEGQKGKGKGKGKNAKDKKKGANKDVNKNGGKQDGKKKDGKGDPSPMKAEMDKFISKARASGASYFEALCQWKNSDELWAIYCTLSEAEIKRRRY